MTTKTSYDTTYIEKRLKLLLEQFPVQVSNEFHYLWIDDAGACHSRFLGKDDEQYDHQFRHLLDNLFPDMSTYRQECNQAPWHGVYVKSTQSGFTIEWKDKLSTEQLFEALVEF